MAPHDILNTNRITCFSYCSFHLPTWAVWCQAAASHNIVISTKVTHLTSLVLPTKLLTFVRKTHTLKSLRIDSCFRILNFDRLYFQNQTRLAISNLECMLRWIHIIDGEPCPLQAMYTFRTSMHVSNKVKLVYSYLRLITTWCTYNHHSIKLHPKALYASMFCVYVSTCIRNTCTKCRHTYLVKPSSRRHTCGRWNKIQSPNTFTVA